MAEKKTRITEERLGIIVAIVAAILTILGITVFNSLAVTAVCGGLTILALFFVVVAYSAR